MEQIVNKKYAGIFTNKKRYTILMGGRGAGRSTVASQYFLAKLIAPEYFRGAIMRFILSDIRNSSFREILDRAEEQGILDKLQVNDGLMTISYGANSIHAHGFRKSSGDQRAKLKSLANYNQVWIEEADEVPENDFMQLDDSLRTVKADINIMLTLNPPPKAHWIIERFFNLLPSEQPNFYLPECKDPNALYIRTDWRDNAINISQQTAGQYESYKNSKPSHYWNMIRGYVPESVEGKIYNGWREIPSVPFEARLMGRGLDFGWDPDPAACVDMYYYNGGYIFDEVFYQTQMRNSDIATNIKAQPKQTVVIADSAEPKSIAEISLAGINIQPCEKGADSVSHGIGLIQGVPISFTSRSVHLKKEYENYAWKKSKSEGEIIAGVPNPGNDHCLDAARYIASFVIPTQQRWDIFANIPPMPVKEMDNPAR